MMGSSISLSWISVGGITMLQSMKSAMASVRSLSVSAKKASRQNTCQSRNTLSFCSPEPNPAGDRHCRIRSSSLSFSPSQPSERPSRGHFRCSPSHSRWGPPAQRRNERGRNSPGRTPSPQSPSVSQMPPPASAGSPGHLTETFSFSHVCQDLETMRLSVNVPERTTEASMLSELSLCRNNNTMKAMFVM